MNKQDIKTVLRYGGRKSDKLIRCYHKRELDVFRVELELHSGLLRRHKIRKVDDLVKLPGLILSKHMKMVDIDWDRLERHIQKAFPLESLRIVLSAKERAGSLRRFRRYLRRMGVRNIHRFLVPIALNDEIKNVLSHWARHFLSTTK